MAYGNFKKHSRTEWSGESTTENINSGSLQRIADATEAMSKNYIQLLEQVEVLRKANAEHWVRYNKQERKIIAYKGVITKLKKRL